MFNYIINLQDSKSQKKRKRDKKEKTSMKNNPRKKKIKIGIEILNDDCLVEIFSYLTKKEKLQMEDGKYIILSIIELSKE